MSASTVAVGRYLLVGLLGFGAGWGGRELLAQKRMAEAKAQQTAAAAKRKNDATCVLAMRNAAPIVPVFEALGRAKEFAEAARRGEPQTTLDLILKDAEGMIVERGTPCSTIGQSYSGVREVRVLAGKYQGKTGFVPDEWRTPE